MSARAASSADHVVGRAGGVGSWTIAPSARKITRSAYAAATRVVGDHHDRLAEVVDASGAGSSSTSALARESRLPVGSSAKTTAGLETSARATATRCCWPPESSAGRWVRRSPQADRADQLGRARPGRACARRSRAAAPMFSSARQHRQQVEELEDEAELVAAQLGQLAVVEAGDLVAVERDRARGRRVEAGEDVHQGRLARARRAHDRGEAAALETGADLDQGVDGGAALAVATGHVVGDDYLPVRSLMGRHRIEIGR